MTYDVYSVAATTGVATSIGSGTVGTLLDITDFFTGEYDNYMVLRFAASTASQTIYGGKLFGMNDGTAAGVGILPQDFVVNDDS